MKHLTKNKYRFRFYLSSQNKILAILVSSLYFGIICGSIMLRSAEQLNSVLMGYAQSITTQAPPGHIILNDFIIYFIYFCSLFLLGMSVYGYILIPVFSVFQGRILRFFFIIFICGLRSARYYSMCACNNTASHIFFRFSHNRMLFFI